MAIETHDLVIQKSERMTDTEEGGGKNSGIIIVDGRSNEVMDDITQRDRTTGDVSVRKVFASVVSADNDALMGPVFFIAENPEDPAVSVCMFSTGSHTDQRQSIISRIENYLAKGAQVAGVPLDNHFKGMKTLQVVMHPQEGTCSTGDAIVLCSDEGKPTEFLQFLRITKVETRTAILADEGKNIEIKIAKYDLNSALAQDFEGLSAAAWYSGNKSRTVVRDTIVADSGKYYGTKNLASDAQVGDFTVKLEGIFTQLAPTSQVETPIIDVDAVGQNTTLIAGNNKVIDVAFKNVVISTTQRLYIGSSVMPGSLSMSLFGQSVTDHAGLLRDQTGAQLGTIDYQNGVITWTSSANTGTVDLSVRFTPAVAPILPYKSASLMVTIANQSMNYTDMLVPKPAPKSFSISYMSQGRYYTLTDDGMGALRGADSAFGSGSINYATGSWLLTCGALPDVGTPILMQWGSPIATFVRSDFTTSGAYLDFDLGFESVSSVVATWLVGSTTYTASVGNDGKFTGDGTGNINFSKGTGQLRLNTLPPKGTTINMTFYHGPASEQVFESVSPDSDGKLTITIGRVEKNTLELEVPVAGSARSTVFLTDVPVTADLGNLVDQLGNVQGTITYSTGRCVFEPWADVMMYVTHYSNVLKEDNF